MTAGTTQGQITDLLRRRGIRTQWTDTGLSTLLRFIWLCEKKELMGRIELINPEAPAQRATTRSAPAAERRERELNRQFRCLLAWFKGQLAAVDAGLFSMHEAFSPFIELDAKSGATVGQVIPALVVSGRMPALPAAAGAQR